MHVTLNISRYIHTYMYIHISYRVNHVKLPREAIDTYRYSIDALETIEISHIVFFFFYFYRKCEIIIKDQSNQFSDFF